MDKKIFGVPAGLLFVVILSLIPLLTLLPPGIPLTHDGKDHIARIANFYTSLSEGNLVPRWAGNLNWGFGHPVMMFLYPLSSYFASILYFIGFSFTDSVKLVFAIGFISSGITMYFWARNQFSESTGIVMAILYIYAPYRFVDMYVRGAIGEHMAFVFLPLALYFVYKFHHSKKLIIERYMIFLMISFSISFLILSHNAMSIMFLPVILAYAVFLSVINSEWRKLAYLLAAIVFGFLLSSFFLIPAFIEGKYTLRDIVTGDEYKTRFVDPLRLLSSSWSYGITGQFSVEIGYIHLAGVLLSTYVFWKYTRKKNKNKTILLIGSLFFLAVSIFLVLPVSNFVYEFITVLKKFQFPWRFLSLGVFSSAVVAGIVFDSVKNIKAKRTILLLGLLFILMYSYKMWQPNGYLYRDDSFYSSIYDGTTDTGESSPLWSTRFMEKRAGEPSSIIDGEGVVQEVGRTSTSHKYLITIKSDTARVRENTVYFPGWTVYDNKKVVDIEYQDPGNRGLITYNLGKGTHGVEVKFEDTKIRRFSNLLTISAFGILVIGYFYFKFKK